MGRGGLARLHRLGMRTPPLCPRGDPGQALRRHRRRARLRIRRGGGGRRSARRRSDGGVRGAGAAIFYFTALIRAISWFAQAMAPSTEGRTGSNPF